MPVRSTIARDHDRREVVGPDARERAAVAADGRADGVDDPGLAERSVEIPSHGPIVAREPSARARRRGGMPSRPPLAAPLRAGALGRRRHRRRRVRRRRDATPPASPARAVRPPRPRTVRRSPRRRTRGGRGPHRPPDRPDRHRPAGGDAGGFVRLETVMSRVPEFTLYGDGRVLVLAAGRRLRPPATPTIPTLRELRLTEDEIQALLRFALVDGQLGTARDDTPATWMPRRRRSSCTRTARTARSWSPA